MPKPPLPLVPLLRVLRPLVARPTLPKPVVRVPKTAPPQLPIKKRIRKLLALDQPFDRRREPRPQPPPQTQDPVIRELNHNQGMQVARKLGLVATHHHELTQQELSRLFYAQVKQLPIKEQRVMYNVFGLDLLQLKNLYVVGRMVRRFVDESPAMPQRAAAVCFAAGSNGVVGCNHLMQYYSQQPLESGLRWLLKERAKYNVPLDAHGYTVLFTGVAKRREISPEFQRQLVLLFNRAALDSRQHRVRINKAHWNCFLGAIFRVRDAASLEYAWDVARIGMPSAFHDVPEDEPEGIDAPREHRFGFDAITMTTILMGVRRFPDLQRRAEVVETVWRSIGRQGGQLAIDARLAQAYVDCFDGPGQAPRRLELIDMFFRPTGPHQRTAYTDRAEQQARRMLLQAAAGARDEHHAARAAHTSGSPTPVHPFLRR